jgi:hypothetical protein
MSKKGIFKQHESVRTEVEASLAATEQNVRFWEELYGEKNMVSLGLAHKKEAIAYYRELLTYSEQALEAVRLDLTNHNLWNKMTLRGSISLSMDNESAQWKAYEELGEIFHRASSFSPEAILQALARIDEWTLEEERDAVRQRVMVLLGEVLAKQTQVNSLAFFRPAQETLLQSENTERVYHDISS